MASVSNHNRIIHQAAKQYLVREGLFQKGASRVWIDDNGWFLIVVEFQPSGGQKGTYLNVGIHYLWGENEELSFDYGYREGAFVSYEDDDERFLVQMQVLAESAFKKVVDYRRFQNLKYAEKQILNHRKRDTSLHQIYQKMMICGLCGDRKGKKYFFQLCDALQSAQFDWEKAYNKELTERIAPIIDDSQKLQAYILRKIETRRMLLRAKSGMHMLQESRQTS